MRFSSLDSPNGCRKGRLEFGSCFTAPSVPCEGLLNGRRRYGENIDGDS